MPSRASGIANVNGRESVLILSIAVTFIAFSRLELGEASRFLKCKAGLAFRPIGPVPMG